MIEKVTVKRDQNLADLVIQEMGSIDGFTAFCKRNALAVDADPVTDSVLDVETTEVTNATTRAFFKSNERTLASERVDNVAYPDEVFDEGFDDSFL